MTIRPYSRRFSLALVVAGLLTFVLSRVVEHGFVHGLFQGMTVSLMILAAVIFGSSLGARGEQPRDKGMWLPRRYRS